MKSNINSIYRYHSDKKIYQGDIFRDVRVIVDYSPFNDKGEIINEFQIPYVVVLSQDCDLNQDNNSYNSYKLHNNQKEFENSKSVYDKCLPSILLGAAYPAEKLRDGKHLMEYKNVSLPHLNKNQWKDIKQNNNKRYHFLEKNTDTQLPDLVVDFKRYYALPTSYLYSIFDDSYLISLNELYREVLSSRFCNFLSRIGLPD